METKQATPFYIDSRLYAHNEPLAQQMRKDGFRLVKRKGLTFYVDSEDKYVPYPTGFITVGSNRGVTYISVKNADGTWWQRNTTDINQAIEVAKKELEKDV